MKRILLHGIFWLVYLLQDTVLEFVWVGPALKDIPENIQFWMAFKAAIAAVLSKLLFTYFALYVAIKQIINGNVGLNRIMLQVAAAVIITIVLHRIVFVYYINPVIYHGVLKERPILNVLGILLAIMDIGFVSGVAIILKLLRIQLAAREREKNLIKEKLEAELKFLRHQTNPHFLFNTLNNIYALARKRSEHTAEVVMRLSKLLRFILYGSKSNLISIADELKVLDDYIELEKMRYERLTIQFEREIDENTQQIAPLLLLPFVENAFKHGASESRFTSFIRIRVQLQKGILIFNIENTKENHTSEEIRDNIGLRNVRRQLELMYKEYDLQLKNEPNIFSVHLYINLTSYAQV
ncbi:sensor histidine kinase [Niastella sp. OAS944]|uniref:sensor histidine kinase n=1 Tax=Niastella sp. OAS944 TaxID=2664089 RepID=UPI0035C7DB09|nr:sensor histidine kinase YesM [Chitinophagaceae bacterium OAS944]